jgi:hypothetical protein
VLADSCSNYTYFHMHEDRCRENVFCVHVSPTHSFVRRCRQRCVYTGGTAAAVHGTVLTKLIIYLTFIALNGEMIELEWQGRVREGP